MKVPSKYKWSIPGFYLRGYEDNICILAGVYNMTYVQDHENWGNPY